MNEVPELLRQIHSELRAINHHLHGRVKSRACVSLKFWSMLSAMMTASLALVLIVGSDARFSANAYWGVASFGGAKLWGLSFFIASLATMIAVWQSPRQLRWTLIVQAIPYIGLSAAFLVASLRFDDANLTAAPVYGWIAVMTLCLADYARRCFKD